MAQWKDIGNPDATTTDSLHGKIGTDTEMADNSLYDLLGAGTKTLDLSAAIGSSIDGATTDTLHGKIGTDTELADNSLYDLLGAGSKTLAISTSVGSDVDIVTTDTLHGKLGTDTELADRSVFDLVCGDGPASYPAAAAPANDVSLAEVLRIIYDRQFGDGTSAAQNCVLGKRIQRAAGDILDSSTTAVFTVGTGEVLLTGLFAKVNTAAVDAGACNLKFQSNPTTGTTTNLCATLDVDADEAGSLYSVNGAVATALVRSESGAVPAMATHMVLPPGNIEIVTDADGGTGGATLELWLYYVPLDDAATVVAA